jgi:hypothetical protein
VVRRLVDAAVERGLKTWKAGEAKRDAIEDAINQLPWLMKYDKAWEAQAAKIAREALKDASGNKEEMASLARTALQPLIQQFEHAGKIEEAVNAVRSMALITRSYATLANVSAKRWKPCRRTPPGGKSAQPETRHCCP